MSCEVVKVFKLRPRDIHSLPPPNQTPRIRSFVTCFALNLFDILRRSTVNPDMPEEIAASRRRLAPNSDGKENEMISRGREKGVRAIFNDEILLFRRKVGKILLITSIIKLIKFFLLVHREKMRFD